MNNKPIVYRNIIKVLLLIPLLMVSSVQGAEGTDAIYYHGDVVGIAPPHIVISEYNLDQDKKINVTYVLDAKVTLENRKSTSDIKPGDSIMFSYVIKGGKDTIGSLLIGDKEKDSIRVWADSLKRALNMPLEKESVQ